MKQVNILLSLCLITCSTTICLHAQQRSIDMELMYDSLEPVDTLPVGSSIPYAATLVNHGPDSLIAGDTLFISLADGSGTAFMMPSALASGGSISLFDLTISYSGDTTKTFNICTKIFDDPNHQVAIGGQPVSVSYIDPNPGNNEACSQVTILAGGSTAVNDIGKSGEGFKVYPNPAPNGQVNIEIPEGQSINMVRIYNVMGAEIMKADGNNRAEQSLQIPDYIPNGIYLMHISTTKEEQVLRLQVIR